MREIASNVKEAFSEMDRDALLEILTFVVKESPRVIPFPTFTYTEENGFSGGVAVSALNVAGRGIRASGSALFGGTTQYRLGLDAPWLFGRHHESANLFVAHRERADELRGFNENSGELTAQAGRYLGRALGGMQTK